MLNPSQVDVDLYGDGSHSPSHSASGGPDNDQAADDRIADAFRREFMDAVQARRTKRPVPTTAPGLGGKKAEPPKGPKLGGSRSARAAMREVLEKGAKR